MIRQKKKPEVRLIKYRVTRVSNNREVISASARPIPEHQHATLFLISSSHHTHISNVSEACAARDSIVASVEQRTLVLRYVGKVPWSIAELPTVPPSARFPSRLKTMSSMLCGPLRCPTTCQYFRLYAGRILSIDFLPLLQASDSLLLESD